MDSEVVRFIPVTNYVSTTQLVGGHRHRTAQTANCYSVRWSEWVLIQHCPLSPVQYSTVQLLPSQTVTLSNTVHHHQYSTVQLLPSQTVTLSNTVHYHQYSTVQYSCYPARQWHYPTLSTITSTVQYSTAATQPDSDTIQHCPLSPVQYSTVQLVPSQTVTLGKQH